MSRTPQSGTASLDRSVQFGRVSGAAVTRYDALLLAHDGVLVTLTDRLTLQAAARRALWEVGALDPSQADSQNTHSDRPTLERPRDDDRANTRL